MIPVKDIKTRLIPALIIITLGIAGSCRKETFSPSQADSFIKFYGVSHHDKGFDVKALADGGFIIAGTTENNSTGSDILIVRTDRFGNEQWGPKHYNLSGEDKVFSITEVAGGGFALTGSTRVSTNGTSESSNVLLVRLNNQGDTLWTRNYGNASNDKGHHLAATSDGGFIIIGSSVNSQTGNSDILLVKTDQDGNLEWTRTHGGSGNETGTYIAETGYGYIYAGSTSSYSQHGQSNSNIFIVRTNALGRVTFPYTYGGNGNDTGKSIIPLSGGGYILLGTITNPQTGVKSIYLAQTEDDISRLVWSHTYGGQTDHIPSSLKRTSDGSLVIAGTQETGGNNHSIFLLKTDASGNEILRKTYGGTGQQRAEALDLVNDGGFVIAGSNEISGNSMVTLIKTRADGEL